MDAICFGQGARFCFSFSESVNKMAQSTSGKPYTGFIIFIHTTIKLNDRKEVTSQITELGGTVTGMLTPKTTHICVAKSIRSSSDYTLRKGVCWTCDW
jgi:hypothetical protein